MNPTRTGFGLWTGGLFMRFGASIGAERLGALARRAYDLGVRTFMTADVYGAGEADRILGRALAGLDRSSYCLIGMIGNDFYEGKREGEKGFPRFTDPALRSAGDYGNYLKLATTRALDRCGTDHFDVLLLHNPDRIGYSSREVWDGMAALKKAGHARALGIAPGPANGFVLDTIQAFERCAGLIEYAMLILNPLEPWPGGLALPAARKHGVKVIARVVDHGGLFHDGIRSGHKFDRTDHRSFRPAGWVEEGLEKISGMRPIAERHGLSLLQLSASWCLAQEPVVSVIPTLMQELDGAGKPIDAQLEDLAALPAEARLTREEVAEIARLGDNQGSMPLKGGSRQYQGEPQADQWPITPELEEVARRWSLEPDRDLYCDHDLRDLREKGAPARGVPSAFDRRLFVQLQVFTGCADGGATAAVALEKSGLECVLYADVNDARGIGVLTLAEDPEDLVGRARATLAAEPFARLVPRPEFAMLGRSYATGRETDLADWLLQKPRRYALAEENRWALWYPLRFTGEFSRLKPKDRSKIVMEHAMIGRTFGEAGYADDIRLECHGLDPNDNEFVLGILGADLYRLSRLIREMRGTRQTAEFIRNLGPFFVGRVIRQFRR
ncbi:MAG: chlorite dismutase family protein [Planctomycetes bacterium]|nr:chlorite dismutase family protein [Planctomycetota bacterium]